MPHLPRLHANTSQRSNVTAKRRACQDHRRSNSNAFKAHAPARSADNGVSPAGSVPDGMPSGTSRRGKIAGPDASARMPVRIAGSGVPMPFHDSACFRRPGSVSTLLCPISVGLVASRAGVVVTFYPRVPGAGASLPPAVPGSSPREPSVFLAVAPPQRTCGGTRCAGLLRAGRANGRACGSLAGR